MNVIKRDGRKVPFDPSKIEAAIGKAILALKENKLEISANDPKFEIDHRAQAVAADVVATIAKDKDISVEDIQDLVEKELIKHNLPDIAKEYILYRKERSNTRQMRSSLNRVIDSILTIDAIKDDDRRENANINTDSVMGKMLKVGSTAMKNFNLSSWIKPKYSKMHQDGLIHIHDLDFASFTINCIHIPLDKLLKDGYSTGHGFLRSPSNIRTAAALTCIAIQASQNDYF